MPTIRSVVVRYPGGRTKTYQEENCACGCGSSCYGKYARGHNPKSRGNNRVVATAEQFWNLVDTTGDCWVWTGRTDANGYGSISRHIWGTSRAHRVAWLLTYGALPEVGVLHHCDNPPCVRPDHLFLGTQKDNMGDASNKGRTRGHEKLTNSEVAAIRVSTQTQATLAAQYRVNGSTISRIRNLKRRKRMHDEGVVV